MFVYFNEAIMLKSFHSLSCLSLILSRVAQNGEILEKLTSLCGLGFVLGPMVQCN